MIVLFNVLLYFVTVFGNDQEGENSKQTRLLLHTDLDLTQQITLLTSRLDTHQASLTSLFDKNTALSKTVDEQQATNANLTGLNNALSKKVNTQQATLTNLTDFNNVLSKTVNVQQANLANVTDLNNALSKNVNTQQATLTNLTNLISALSRKVDEQQRVIVNLTYVGNENAELSKKVNSQQATLVNLADKNTELSFKLDSLTHQLAMKDQDIQTLKSTIEHQTGTGSTYTRWGRTICPGNGTDLVYEGYMGSSTRSNTGGGINYLCLSSDPQWDHYDETIGSGSTIVGVEYEFYYFRGQDGASQFFGKNIYNDDAPCAVCHTKRSTTLMIPGRTDCYSGWTKEYSGYIVSAHNTEIHPSEFICLDRRPDVVVGGKTNDNEAIFSLVEASCGKSLECPPYIQGRELACVVCSL